MGWIRVLALSGAACVLFSSLAAARATYTTFAADSVAGINSSNTVTGSNGSVGFLRTVDGSVTAFSVTGAKVTLPQTINDLGAVAGIYETDHLHGFVRSAEGDIATFDGPGASDTYVVGINNSGEVAGWYWDGATSDHALVRAPDGTLTTFDIPGENSTTPSSINEGGVITGSYIGYDGFDHGFIRAANGTITSFDVPGANYGTVAESINIHGDVAGAYWVSNSIEYGFVRRADGTITTFDYEDCALFDPRGINRKQVVTGWCLLEKGGHFLGFVWRPNRAVRSFHVPGNGFHTRPAGINDEGVIVGEYNGGGFLRFP